MTARLVGALLAALALSGCEITVCELPEEDNVCDDDADCLLAFCGTNCCPCEMVVSRRQLEGTYCMVPVAEGFEAAREECREARETVCEGVSCTGLSACPHPRRARCDGGRCVAAYD
jgi:hypothetical protein